MRQITDQSAAAVHQYSYSPFGVPRGGYLNHPKQQVSEAVSYNPYGFTGERHDTALGLVHLRTRDYQPEIGRFVRPDIFPGFLAQPLTLNEYGYVSNDPINLVDPLRMLGEAIDSLRGQLSERIDSIDSDFLANLNKHTSYAGGVLAGASVILGIASLVVAAPVAAPLAAAAAAIGYLGIVATVANAGVNLVQWWKGDISADEAKLNIAWDVAGVVSLGVGSQLSVAARGWGTFAGTVDDASRAALSVKISGDVMATSWAIGSWFKAVAQNHGKQRVPSD